MLERVRERFVRRTPQGRPDVAGTIRHVVGDPRSDNELNSEEYLQTLSEQDRVHVAEFVDFVRTLNDALPGVRVAVTAVGSTTRPEAERHHPAKDIDLRVLNSSPVGSPERAEVVAAIQERVKDFLKSRGVKFDDAGHTVLTRMVWGYIGSQGELLQFVDWYNNDPSVIARYDKGLPLHISISGVDNVDLDTYLRKEREHNGHFVVLHNPTQESLIFITNDLFLSS